MTNVIALLLVLQVSNGHASTKEESVYSPLIVDAQKYESVKDFESALKLYRKAFNKKQDYLTSTKGLVRIYVSSGQARKAENIVDEAITEKPLDLDLRAIRVEFYAQTQRPEKELEAITEIRKLAPTERFWIYREALAHLNQKNDAEALKLFNEYAKGSIEPYATQLYSGKALALMRTKQQSLAEAEIKKAIADRPFDATVRALAAEVYFEGGHYVVTINETEQCTRIDYKATHCYALRGKAYSKINQQPKAHAAFKKAVELDAYSADNRFAYAEFLAATEQWLEHDIQANTLLEIHPTHHTGVKLWFSSLMKRNLLQRALEILLSYHVQNPTDHWVAIEASELLRIDQHYNRAKKILKETESEKFQAAIDMQMAHVLWASGDIKESQNILSKIDSEMKNVAAHNLGVIHFKNGDVEKAHAEWARMPAQIKPDINDPKLGWQRVNP